MALFSNLQLCTSRDSAKPTFWWLLIAVSLAPLAAMAQLPVFSIDTGSIGSSVDSHPYSIIIDEANMLGYASICGDVAPFGEPIENYSNNKVIEFDALTLQVIRSFTVGYYPTEMLLAHGDLWVTCSAGNQLYRVDLDGAEPTSIALVDSTGAAITFPSGLALGANGEIYVASNGGDFDGSSENIVSIDPDTQQILQHYEVSGGISVMAYLSDGSLLVPVGFPGGDFTAAPVLLWIDPFSGEIIFELPIDVDTADFPAPSDLKILPDDTALLTIFGGSAIVYRIDLVSRSLHSIYTVPGSDTVQTAVAIDSDNSFVVAEFFSNRLSRIDLTTGLATGLLDGVNLPNDIQIAAGRIFTTEQGGESIAVHASTDAFLRADVNLDGFVDVADPVALLEYLFLGSAISCLDAGDISDDGALDLGDPVQLLTFLFSQGSAPAYPFPVVGADLTDDTLDCVGGL